MIRKLYYLLVVIFISLSACTDAATNALEQTLSKDKTEITTEALEKALSKNKTESTQVTDICFERKTREEKFSCLYERFEYESVLCSKLEKLVREKGFIQKIKKDFYSPDGGVKPLIIILNGPLSEDPDVRYLVTHSTYFEIDIDYHYQPPGVVGIAETDIYCAPTIKRLHELEYLGRSDLAWRAREKWLDYALKHLNWPWDEMASYDGNFFNEFEHVKKVYNSEEDKKRLQQWIDKAEKFFFQSAESQDIEGSAGKTKKEHLETLRQWVENMRKGL